MFRAKRDIKKQTLQADPKLAMEPKQLPTQTAGRGCFADVSSEARHQKTDPAGRPTGSLHSPNNQHCRHRNEVSSGPCSLRLAAKPTHKLLTSLLPHQQRAKSTRSAQHLPKQLPPKTAGRRCFADVSSEARHQKTNPAGRPKARYGAKTAAHLNGRKGMFYRCFERSETSKNRPCRPTHRLTT